MKTIFYALSFLGLFTLTSCEQEEESTTENTEELSADCKEVEYDIQFSMKKEEVICLPDGKSIVLELIEDQFCPCDVICVWQGELSAMLTTEDEEGNKDLITVGTESIRVNNELFSDVEIKSLDYLYNGLPNSLPDCNNDFSEENVEVLITVTKI